MKINKKDKFDIGLDESFEKKLKQDILLKFVDCEMKFPIYKVTYSYKTARGNKKENDKYLIASDETDAKFRFLDYINEFNKEKPYRAISNVKILDVVYTASVFK